MALPRFEHAVDPKAVFLRLDDLQQPVFQALELLRRQGTLEHRLLDPLTER